MVQWSLAGRKDRRHLAWVAALRKSVINLFDGKEHPLERALTPKSWSWMAIGEGTYLLGYDGSRRARQILLNSSLVWSNKIQYKPLL
jgi:hypothetical protein